MELKYRFPSPQAVPYGESTPPDSAPEPCIDSGYMDGSVQAYSGANPGRDQDRSRICECIPASYSYSGKPSGTEQENETGQAEGF